MSHEPVSHEVKDCDYPWTWLMLTSDGSVRPCCFAPGQLGNLNEAELPDIWNGPVAIELRTYIKANRIHPVCAGAPCKFVRGMTPVAIVPGPAPASDDR